MSVQGRGNRGLGGGGGCSGECACAACDHVGFGVYRQGNGGLCGIAAGGGIDERSKVIGPAASLQCGNGPTRRLWHLTSRRQGWL